MKKVALVGAPNSGKTTLFNRLTGLRQKIGNYPGVTVEHVTGKLSVPSNIEVTDLPGTYSFDIQSEDQKVTFEALQKEHYDLIVVVLDATHLNVTLGSALDLKASNYPMMIALNMMDLAEKDQLKVNVNALSEALDIPVIPISAATGQGLTELTQAIDEKCQKEAQGAPALKPSTEEHLLERAKRVQEILSSVIETKKAKQKTNSFDRIAMHPIWGSLLFLVCMFVIFQAVFAIAQTPMGWIEMGFEALKGFVENLITVERLGSILSESVIDHLRSLMVDGAIEGVMSVVIFLPQILILFAFIYLLEGSGYMARVAFLLDRFMRFFGLEGKAFIPLLSSHACAIPGMMSARTIKDPRVRLVTMLIAPLMTCSARLPVYVLLIGAFIADQPLIEGGFLGEWVRLQGFVFFCLYFIAIFSALCVSFVFQKTILKGKPSPFIMELPRYRWPNMGYIGTNLFQKGKAFLVKAGTLIFCVSVILWALSTFPKAPEGTPENEAIEYSAAGRIGAAIEPVLRPLGFDWRISAGLIPGFAAREVMVSSLGIVFAIEEDVEEEGSVGHEKLKTSIDKAWGLPTALALLIWYVFSPQCLATFAVARREMGNWKWPLIGFFYMLSLAYLSALLVYQVTSRIEGLN